jgi:opacity protein-like surface antigen
MRNRSLIPVNSQMLPGARRFVRRLATSLAVASSLIVVAAPAQADEEPPSNNFELTPFIGLMAGGSFEEPSTGDERDVEDDTSYGIFFNIVADVPERQYEFFYTKQGSVVEGGVPIDLDTEYLQLGGSVAYPQSRHVIPYFGMTVGATRFSPDLAGLDDETKLSFSVGGGMKFPITDRIGIRFDARALITLLDNDSEIFCVSVPETATCLIKPESDTFIQYMGSLGVSFGF